MNIAAIRRAIECLDSQAAFAKAVGVHPTFVSQWVTGRRPVPPRYCIPIEIAVRGAVTRHDLRPDIFGPAPSKEGEAA